MFYRNSAGEVFHTNSTCARALDMLKFAYHYLDIVPKGRDEGDRGLYGVRRRDEYDNQNAELLPLRPPLHAPIAPASLLARQRAARCVHRAPR